MGNPTLTSQYRWITQPGKDFLQLNTVGSPNPVSRIDSTGTGFGKLAGGASSSSIALFSVLTNCGGAANCFQVKADAQATPDASYTSGGSTITTGSNAPPFCDGITLPCTSAQIAVGHTTDVGMIAVALGNCNVN